MTLFKIDQQMLEWDLVSKISYLNLQNRIEIKEYKKRKKNIN